MRLDDLSKANVSDSVSDQRRVFAPVHLDGVEAGVAGLVAMAVPSAEVKLC